MVDDLAPGFGEVYDANMSRRIFLFLVIDWMIIWRHRRDDARCYIAGIRRDRTALTECVYVNGRWRSGKVYAQ